MLCPGQAKVRWLSRPSVTNTPRKGKWVKKDYPELEGHNIKWR
jgi:hypothetical protein